MGPALSCTVEKQPNVKSGLHGSNEASSYTARHRCLQALLIEATTASPLGA
jgi:hypothetical protein